MSKKYHKRLQKELKNLQKYVNDGVILESADNLEEWYIKILGAEGSLFEGEEFTLRFKFDSMYPMEAPEVIFFGNAVPEHPHIYTNGHICLSILYDNWSPALSVSSVCLSILSMLSSCEEKGRPPDNDSYVRMNVSSPKKTTWVFHDDSV
eukprot:TRINITY_DN13550_c0_g1_i1.p1 TRINITY_DN13550_c0_g1~~TRINITY_DN13550_c0_g1_i1.p1  ORF type:complete len:150 (+),score=43.14 TRINITY_DN13550_c0_g1_i1:42-491(+)